MSEFLDELLDELFDGVHGVEGLAWGNIDDIPVGDAGVVFPLGELLAHHGAVFGFVQEDDALRVLEVFEQEAARHAWWLWGCDAALLEGGEGDFGDGADVDLAGPVDA